MDDQALRNYFEFDQADLDANRNGKLSEKQEQKLAELEKGLKPFAIGLIVVLFGIAAILPLAEKKFDLFSILWALVWAGLGCYAFYVNFINKSNSVSKIKIRKAEGPVRTALFGSSNTGEKEYELRIGKELFFPVYHELIHIMKKGDIFAIYYRKDNDGNHAMSAEWLSSGE